MRHYRISTREAWDDLLGEVVRWAGERGETAALWVSMEKMSVRFVAGADAMAVTQGWRVLWAVTPGETRPAGISDRAWERYDLQRQEYEAGQGRGHRRQHEPQILSVGGPPEPHNPRGPEPGARKKRSDAGVVRGPRHLRTAQTPIIVED